MVNSGYIFASDDAQCWSKGKVYVVKHNCKAGQTIYKPTAAPINNEDVIKYIILVNISN